MITYLVHTWRQDTSKDASLCGCTPPVISNQLGKLSEEGVRYLDNLVCFQAPDMYSMGDVSHLIGICVV